MSTFFVPTRFTWRFGGSLVYLCGSFTRWVETVPMAAVDGQQGIHSVVVHLPPGYHQYKFIVDGEWRHDETQPYMPDPLGNVNNWLFVRRVDQHNQQQTTTESLLPQGSHGPQLQPLAHPQQGQVSSRSHGSLQAQLSQQHSQSLPVSLHEQNAPQQSAHGDVEMATESSIDSQQAPITAQVEEPAYTRKRVREFLSSHTCYELIPESGKVVLLDTDLPVRQAFHALHEQGVASAPLWDSQCVAVVGMISASDFIHLLRQLRSNVNSGANPMSEAEMDVHTIRTMREQGAADGRPAKKLVALGPMENMQQVITRLFRNRCSMAPVLTCDAHGHNQAGGQNEGNVNTLLHIATISGVLASLMRHFRASLSSLPLLSQPIGRLPIGTWSPDVHLPQLEDCFAELQGAEGRDQRRIRPLHFVQPKTPLTQALSLLLDAGVSVLPVVDEEGRLLDMYARSDITALAKGNSYSRLQWEEVTVGQALVLAQPGNGWLGVNSQVEAGQATKAQRVHLCTIRDNLRAVVERLCVPGVRRLFVIEAETRKVWGILSLSDVAAFLFDVV